MLVGLSTWKPPFTTISLAATSLLPHICQEPIIITSYSFVTSGNCLIPTTARCCSRNTCISSISIPLAPAQPRIRRPSFKNNPTSVQHLHSRSPHSATFLSCKIRHPNGERAGWLYLQPYGTPVTFISATTGTLLFTIAWWAHGVMVLR